MPRQFHQRTGMRVSVGALVAARERRETDGEERPQYHQKREGQPYHTVGSTCIPVPNTESPGHYTRPLPQAYLLWCVYLGPNPSRQRRSVAASATRSCGMQGECTVYLDVSTDYRLPDNILRLR